MLGDILLKMVSVVTPEDVKQLKGAGYADEVKAVLGYLERLAVSWRYQFGGKSDSRVWADVQIKFNEVRAALREGIVERLEARQIAIPGRRRGNDCQTNKDQSI